MLYPVQPASLCLVPPPVFGNNILYMCCTGYRPFFCAQHSLLCSEKTYYMCAVPGTARFAVLCSACYARKKRIIYMLYPVQPTLLCSVQPPVFWKNILYMLYPVQPAFLCSAQPAMLDKERKNETENILYMLYPVQPALLCSVQPAMLGNKKFL
jgi:hypothetical protein